MSLIPANNKNKPATDTTKTNTPAPAVQTPLLHPNASKSYSHPNMKTSDEVLQEINISRVQKAVKPTGYSPK